MNADVPTGTKRTRGLVLVSDSEPDGASQHSKMENPGAGAGAGAASTAIMHNPNNHDDQNINTGSSSRPYLTSDARAADAAKPCYGGPSSSQKRRWLCPNNTKTASAPSSSSSEGSEEAQPGQAC